jgi:hypothetical protein
MYLKSLLFSRLSIKDSDNIIYKSFDPIFSPFWIIDNNYLLPF